MTQRLQIQRNGESASRKAPATRTGSFARNIPAAHRRFALCIGLVLGLSVPVGCMAPVAFAADPVPSADSSVSEAGRAETGSAENTELVDSLSLPAVAVPVATGASPQTTAPVGRNTSVNLAAPAGVQANANLGFFPSLTLSVSKRDNPARIAGGEDQNDVSWTIVPVLVYRGAIRDRHIYELGASASRESFDELVSLDNDSYNLNAALRLDLTEILKVDLYGDTGQGSDTRGGTATRLLPPGVENDTYEQSRYGGRVTIGRRSNPIAARLWRRTTGS